MNKSFFEKIDALVISVGSKIQDLQSQKDFYHNKYQEILTYKNNPEKYQFELNKNNYCILKIENEIKRSELYLDRCQAYLKYLNSLDTDNPFYEKQTAYNFIKVFQDEAISYYFNLIKELEYKIIVEKSGGLKTDTYALKEKSEAKKNRIFEIFSKGQFHFENEKIYTNSYLDYNIDKTIKNLYEKSKKKAV